jgi:hypothetical protein
MGESPVKEGPMSIAQIEQRRRQVLEEMQTIRSMVRATLKEQMLPVKHKDKKEPVMRGPYYVLARWEQGKTRSRRVPRGEVERVRKDVENHQRFRALCQEFEELTERLGELERQATASREAVKKGLKSQPNKTRK